MKRKRASARQAPAPLATKRKQGAARQSRSSGTATPAVGVVGLGIMGSAMAANLVRGGFVVVGYDVVASRRAQLARAGGRAVGSVSAVGESASAIVTSLPSAAALIDVAGGLAAGFQASAAASKRPAPIVIETSTLPIAVKEEARAILAASGAVLLDCPLGGTGSQARVKDLVVYGSGDRAAFLRAVPVFEGFSRVHYYVGPFGAGSKIKFAGNLLVAIHNVAAAEALVLAMKAGLDPALAVQVLGDGSGSSRMLQVRGPMMASGDYLSDVTMKLDVWQKDLAVIADFARTMGCPTPLFAATIPYYVAATAENPAQDTGAVCAVLEKLANYRRRPRRI